MMTPSFLTVLLLLQAPEAEAGGVRVVLREAPLFSKEELEAARKEPREVGRVTFERAGWFLNTPVEPGTWTLALEGAGRDYRIVLRDPTGAAKGSEGFWIDPPTESPTRPEITMDEGAAVVTLASGGIRLSFRYISGDALASVVRGDEARSGRVIVSSDLNRPELAAALARELDGAIQIHATLIGKPAPPGPFRLYWFAAGKTYQQVDTPVTGGRFQSNGGMASPLTMQAYLWNVPRTDAGLTLRTRTVAIHEIGHLVSYAARPESVAWPTWLGEGLAEEGTYRTLGVDDAAAFHAEQRGKWRFAEMSGNVPVMEDLLVRYAGKDLDGWYTSAYLFTKRLSAEGRTLPDLIGRLEGETLRQRATLSARESIETRSVSLWRAVRDETMKGEAPPAAVYGHLEPEGQGWRLATGPDSQGRALLPSLATPAQGTLEASFAWEPVGLRQVDFYIAYGSGRESAQFLKMAVMPRKIVLFRYCDDRWEDWGRNEFDSALAEGARMWHQAKIDFSGADRKIAVTVDGSRKAEFLLKTFVPSAGTCCGFGGYDSIVHVKNVRVR